MRKLEVRIDARVSASFPDVLVGGFLVTGLDNAAQSLPPGDSLFEEVRAILDSKGLKVETLTLDPRIEAWRTAFAKCGLKPSTFKSSPEQLARRILKGLPVTTLLPVVDNYCMVSAKHLAPLGGYDLDRLGSACIDLRPGSPKTDHFAPLAGRAEDMPIDKNVIVYADGGGVICWAFNHRDSRETSLTGDTRDAVFLGEAVDLSQQGSLRAALAELKEILEGQGAHAGDIAFAHSDCPEIELTTA